MRILIDILHPAHVHVFKNYIKIMERRGHSVLVTSRDKDVAIKLLEKYKIKNVILSKIGKNKINLIKELVLRIWHLAKIARKFKPDVMLGVMGATIAPVGCLLGIPTLVFYGTENARLTNWYVYLMCTKYISPNAYRKKLGKKNIRYEGVHELAYLRPKYFKPNPNILKEVGLKKGENFTIIRLVSWGASHDISHKGISQNLRIKAVREFLNYGKVFISSEKKLLPELDKYRLRVSPEKLHDLIYYAKLVYGESATLASEASVLGTYSIYLDDEGRGFTDELERKYGLVKNFTESKEDQIKSIEYGIEILKNKNAKKEAKEKTRIMLKKTVDLTELMINETDKFK